MDRDEFMNLVYDELHSDGDNNRANRIIDAADEYAAAQPEPHYDEWCDSCKEYDQEKHCCPRWNKVIRQTLADAQPEIIRCKECKHWREGDAYSYCNYLYSCGVLDALDYMRAEDDFCSSAERRTDG